MFETQPQSLPRAMQEHARQPSLQRTGGYTAPNGTPHASRVVSGQGNLARPAARR